MKTSQLTTAYIEAIYFTETGDGDQPSADATLTPLSRMQAYIDCRQFYQAVTRQIPEHQPVDDVDSLNWCSIGHDLWLTRNGHGVSFLDRADVYGHENSVLFYRMSIAMGSHDVDFFKGYENEKSG
jgi:hypothetical protein